MLNLEIVQGTDESWEIQANTEIGPATDLLITDIYTAVLSSRETSPVLFTPGIVWATAGTVIMSVTNGQSRTLTANEVYPVKIFRARGIIFNCIALFNLTCLGAPE